MDAGEVAQAAEAAARRGDWSASLDRWDFCLRTFSGDPGVPHWLAGRAAALTHLGRYTEAEAVYRSLENGYPTRRSGYAGLAWVAERRKDWAAALGHLKDCLARFPDDPAAPEWRKSSAIALEKLGERRAAALLWIALIEYIPDGNAARDWRQSRAYALERLEQPAAARDAWTDLLDRYPDDSAARDWLLARTRGLEKLADAAGAAAGWAELIARHPHDPAARDWRKNRAYALEKLGAREAAIGAWNELIDGFPDDPARVDWRAARAGALDRLGAPREALLEWDALLAEFPDAAAARDWRPARARSLEKSAALREAIAEWTGLIRDYPEEPAARDWRQLRAYALEKSAEHGAAAEAWQSLIDRYPDDRAAREWRVARAGALERVGARTAAAAAWRDLIALHPGSADPEWSIRLAHGENDLEGVRAALRNAVAAAHGVDALERIFTEIPAAFEGWERTSAWLSIDDRLRRLEADAPALELRLRLALRDYDGFLRRIERTPAADEGPWMRELRAASERLRARNFPDFDAPKVFVIGLSRTGTKSVHRALRTLGLRTAHFTNELTCEILSLEDAYLFDGLADIPACVMFETLYHTFPRSKFIYTLRPLPGWIESFDRHSQRTVRQRTGWPNAFDATRDRLTTRRAGAYGAQRALLHGALYYHHATPEAANRAYDRRVRGFFAHADSSRLLEFDIFSGDGWEKLCAFLGVTVPSEPFPWENRAADAGSSPAAGA